MSTYIDPNTEEWIEQLQKENEALKANAIIWHRYPDEKPDIAGYYIIHYGILNRVAFDFWKAGLQTWDKYEEYITHWAYLPAPPKAKGGIVKEQLKPCPSCGAKNTDKVTLISELYDADKYKYGKCFQCGIRMYDWNKRPIEDALQAEIDELHNRISYIETKTEMLYSYVYGKQCNDSAEYSLDNLNIDCEQVKDRIVLLIENIALQAELDQLRKDNQSLVEQIHIMAEFLVAEGICPFTHCIHKQPHTDEDCMFCWEHRGNGTKGDKP